MQNHWDVNENIRQHANNNRTKSKSRQQESDASHECEQYHEGINFLLKNKKQGGFRFIEN